MCFWGGPPTHAHTHRIHTRAPSPPYRPALGLPVTSFYSAIDVLQPHQPGLQQASSAARGAAPCWGVACLVCTHTTDPPAPPPLPRPGGGGCAAPLCMCGCTNTRAKRQWGGRTWRVSGAEQYTLQRFLGFFGLARLHTHAAHPQAERAGMAGTQPPHCLASGAELCVGEWGWKLLRAWRWNISWVRCISSPHTDPHKRAVLHFWCWPFTGGQKAGMHHLHHSTATPPEWHWEHRCRSPLRVCVVGGKWGLET